MKTDVSINNTNMRIGIGLLGYGTVGKGLESLLIDKASDVFFICKILRRIHKANREDMVETMQELLNDSRIDIVVECLGGIEPARTYILEAMNLKKSVVTANKALINRHGDELDACAKANGVVLRFSAAVGGGIPYLATLLEVKKQTQISAIGGILNGTSNFILDKMERECCSFEDALKEAQILGYAEQDPSADILGWDSLNKIRLSGVIAFDTWLKLDSIPCSGIDTIQTQDIEFIQALGYHIRLFATMIKTPQGLSAFVEPQLFNSDNPEATILSNHNIAWYTDMSGEHQVLIGQGAGGIPTAGNILRDLYQIKENAIGMLPDERTFQEVDNSQVAHSYLVRTSKTLKSGFLEALTDVKWIQGNRIYRITKKVEVSRFHSLMKTLKESESLFFAGIRKKDLL
jgi:homoserine dehydrogenase